MHNIDRLNDFVAAVNQCAGQVWLETPEGDRYNLKSIFSQYIAFDRLLAERGEELVLCFSDSKEEQFFREFELA